MEQGMVGHRMNGIRPVGSQWMEQGLVGCRVDGSRPGRVQCGWSEAQLDRGTVGCSVDGARPGWREAQ